MNRKPEMGIVLTVDFTRKTGKIAHPYQIYFFDEGGFDWMREGFLEVVAQV
tara:strand:- start:1055 stop:1207 length:153 start_codon:yes stop_codon:yes gene_type:complete